MSLLLRYKAPVHVRNTAGDLPVHVLLRQYAPSHGLENVVEHLISRRVDLKALDSAGVPPLCRAAASGNQAVVNLLLDDGVDPTGTDSCGRNGLHHVAAGSIEQVAAVRERDKQQPRVTPETTGSPLPVRRPRRATADRIADVSRPVSLFQALQELSAAFANIIKVLVVWFHSIAALFVSCCCNNVA